MARPRCVSFKVGQSRGQGGQSVAPGPGRKHSPPPLALQLSAKPSPVVRREECGPIQGMQPSSCGMPYIELGTAAGAGRAGRPALQAGPRAASLQLAGCSPDQGQSPGPRHVVLGEASWVPDLGSRAAARRGAVSAAAASPPRTAAGSQGRHNGTAVRGTRLCGQPRSVDRGHIQHRRSGSDPRLAPRSVGGPAHPGFQQAA